MYLLVFPVISVIIYQHPVEFTRKIRYKRKVQKDEREPGKATRYTASMFTILAGGPVCPTEPEKRRNKIY